MPFKKYKPLKPWGKIGIWDTRIFRSILRARNLRTMPKFYIDPEIKEMGVPILDPLEPDFMKKLANRTNYFVSSVSPSNQNAVDGFKLARDLHAEQAFVFEGTTGMTEGVDEACALIRALRPSPLPDNVISAIPNGFLPDNFEEQIMDCILAGERYDPTLEPLPKKFDPIIFWIKQRRYYGTPVIKRNNIILLNLYRRVALLSMRNEAQQFKDFRCDIDEPVSAYLPGSQSGVSVPLVFRHKPHIILQSESFISPISNLEGVQNTRKMEVPDVYPITPLIDLEKSSQFDRSPSVPRLSNPPLNLHIVLWAKEQDQKYPWTMEQNAANAVGHCFGAALAQGSILQAKDRLSFVDDDEKDKILKDPVVTKAIQLVDGKLDLVMVQLNTLNLGNSQGVKNLVWLDKACPLYKPRPLNENLTEVEGLDMGTAAKFVSFLLYR